MGGYVSPLASWMLLPYSNALWNIASKAIAISLPFNIEAVTRSQQHEQEVPHEQPRLEQPRYTLTQWRPFLISRS